MSTAMITLLCIALAALLLDIVLKGTVEGLTDKKCGRRGVRGSDIPEGEENMYILKSEIVPPVCPACPSVQVCPEARNKPCRPCPPCGRCPEPAFDCKKVPNYAAPQNQMLPGFYGNASVAGSSAPIGGDAQSSQPMAVLNDFSQFGA
jgi:hypothetical protein